MAFGVIHVGCATVLFAFYLLPIVLSHSAVDSTSLIIFFAFSSFKQHKKETFLKKQKQVK